MVCLPLLTERCADEVGATTDKIVCGGGAFSGELNGGEQEAAVFGGADGRLVVIVDDGSGWVLGENRVLNGAGLQNFEHFAIPCGESAGPGGHGADVAV